MIATEEGRSEALRRAREEGGGAEGGGDPPDTAADVKAKLC